MSLIQARKLRKLRGGVVVLDGLDFDVFEGARLGLVGSNGSGKSTLLRLLAGLEEPDAGKVTRRRNLTVSHLPQSVEGDERDALQTIRVARPDLQALEDEMKLATTRLGSREATSDTRGMQRILETQGNLLHRFREAGGPDFEGEARSTMRSLGLEDSDFRRPTSGLPDGRRKLVALAASLMQKPDVLLLDEPETHLDTARRERLGEVVREFGGAVVVVSHDRYLLDRLVDRVFEVQDGRVTACEGGYGARSENLAEVRDLFEGRS